METRHPDWQEISNYSKIFNFKWKPFSNGIRFEQLSLYGQRQLVNHIINHDEITMKDNMFKNLSKYWMENNLDVFNYVPLTFILEYDKDDLVQNLSFFSLLFEAWSETKLTSNLVSKDEEVKNMNQRLRKIVNENSKFLDIDSIYNKISIPSSHLESNNLWFLKVTKLNRGRGIYVFNSIEQLISLINDWTESIEGYTIVRESEDNKNAATKNKQKWEFIKIPTLSWNRNSICANDGDCTATAK